MDKCEYILRNREDSHINDDRLSCKDSTSYDRLSCKDSTSYGSTSCDND